MKLLAAQFPGIHRAIEKGVKEAWGGVICRISRYSSVQVTTGLVLHEVDSSEMAFKIAASKAFQDGCEG